MDKETALRLIQPLCEGGDVVDGWPLSAIKIHHDGMDHRKDQIHLVFSPTLTLTISYRTQQQAALKTKHFSLGIRNSEAELSKAGREIVSIVSERLQANDTVPPQHWVDGLIQADTPASEEAVLWLIPGHIGNPLDLSIRSLRVLKTVDLMFIEAGSQASVEHIYALFNLGDLPDIFEITHTDDPIVTHLQSGRDAGKTMALFGVNEGVPGLCDPGWQVIQALKHITPSLRVASTSGGSALTTALMYTQHHNGRFVFHELFENTNGTHPIIRALSRITPWEDPPTMFCFAIGAQLLENWHQLSHACRGLQGTMTFLCNLTFPDERVHHMQLSQLPDSPENLLSASDKVVLRIDLHGRQTVGIHWCLRILRWLTT